MTTSQAQQDLAFIRQIMDESRTFATVGGNHFIIWGSVLGLALFGTWGVASGHLSLPVGPIWLVCIGSGWALTYRFIRQQKVQAATLHPSARLIGGSWRALGIAMTLTFFLGTYRGSISIAAIPGLAAAFTGAGIYINGMLARIPWLRNLAYLWWASAAAMLIWTGAGTYALMAALMIALYVIPGFVLNRMARRAAA